LVGGDSFDFSIAAFNSFYPGLIHVFEPESGGKNYPVAGQNYKKNIPRKRTKLEDRALDAFIWIPG
jgi:hypothetical protein